MIRLTLLALALLTASAHAQQQPPDPAFMQRALSAMQTQRNQAMDQAAIAQAQAAQAQEEVAKLRAEIEQLKKPATDPAAPAKK
jgi:cell division protein FtsB